MSQPEGKMTAVPSAFTTLVTNDRATAHDLAAELKGGHDPARITALTRLARARRR